MVIAAAVTPVCALASCSKEDYSALVSEIKELQLDEFMNAENGISSKQRDVWYESNIYKHIKKRMEKILGKDEPDGTDKWSSICEVSSEMQSELGIKEKAHPLVQNIMYPEKDEEYGNLWYDIPATDGHENDPGLMLQAHMDVPMF